MEYIIRFQAVPNCLHGNYLYKSYVHAMLCILYGFRVNIHATEMYLALSIIFPLTLRGIVAFTCCGVVILSRVIIILT